MTKLLTIEALAAATVVLTAAAAGLAGRTAAAEEEPATVSSTFRVEGMTCGGCEAAVERKVGKLAGVTRVEASHKDNHATVTYDQEKVTPERIIAAIEDLGYEAELVEEAAEERRAGIPGPASSLLACC